VTKPTILCISANPALDRRLYLSKITLGEVNRARSVQALPGGKAVHVATAAHALGAKAVWLGFLGGAIGQQCARELARLEIEVVQIPTQAATRVNLELIEDSKTVTEVLEPGGLPTPDECDQMLRACGEGLAGQWKRALVVISGSLPRGMPPDLYLSLIGQARAAGSTLFVDTSGSALAAAVGARPDLVKPNREEAETLLGRPLGDLPAVLDAARELVERGAQSSAITLGSEGLVWLESAASPWHARPPQLKAISTVGCGDATLAGFAYASLQERTGEECLRFAAACGAANCLAELPGRISLDDVRSLLPRVEIARADTTASCTKVQDP
jgi:1-phosphofructokinase family hexose kinase